MAKTLVKSNAIQGLEQGGGIVFITFPDNWRDILNGEVERYGIPANEFEEIFGDVFKNLKLYTIYYLIDGSTQLLVNSLLVNEEGVDVVFGFEFSNITLDFAYTVHIVYIVADNTYNIRNIEI